MRLSQPSDSVWPHQNRGDVFYHPNDDDVVVVKGRHLRKEFITIMDQGTAPSASAEWALMIPEAGGYTVRLWWPNKSGRAWSTSCLVQVHSNGMMVASITLDLNQQGDQVGFRVRVVRVSV